MKEDKDILKQIDHRDGMTVPDGFFADFASKMAQNLPSTPFEQSGSATPRIEKRSLWFRIKPYVYMAAMFMGVWCMLKMFTLMTTKSVESFELSPVLAEAMSNEVFVKDYIIDDINQYDLLDELMDEGVSVEDLYGDFENEPIDDIEL